MPKVSIKGFENISRLFQQMTVSGQGMQQAMLAAAAQFGRISQDVLDAIIEGRQAELKMLSSPTFSCAYDALSSEDKGKYLALHRKDILSPLFLYEVLRETGKDPMPSLDKFKLYLGYSFFEGAFFSWMRVVARWIFPKPDCHAEPGALGLVRVLRKLPHSADFDRHLTDCAALAVFYGPDEDRKLPKLSWGHVLRIRVFPPFVPPEDGVSHLKAQMALRGITLQ